MRKEWRDEVKADPQVGHRLKDVKANMAKGEVAISMAFCEMLGSGL